jgi:periplasmic copper chaperone A
MKARATILAGLCWLGLGSGTALANVTLETTETPVGSTYKAVLRIPHGCRGKPTTEIRVKVPEGFISAKPMPKAGWTLITIAGRYERTYELHGTAISEGTRGITWVGGYLPDIWYDEFVFRGTFAADLEPGTVFYFPTVQVCGDDEVHWVDVSGDQASSYPAPSVRLTPSQLGQ